jgi:hypothetical protein
MSYPCASILLGIFLTACASNYHVVQIPEREADMFPVSQTRDGLTIAVDEIRNAERAKRYFGADLVRAGVVPILVVVSNHSDRRVVIKPADVIMLRSRDIVDPLPLQVVTSIATDQHWFLRDKTRETVEGFFNNVSFKEMVLLPNDTYQGVMFFSSPPPRKQKSSPFFVSSLFAASGPRVQIGVTDLDGPGRVHFGPFYLAARESAITSAQSENFWRP